MDSPRHVFVDTSTYENLKMEWSSGLLERLAREVEADRIVLVTTTVTYQELEGRIEFHAKQHQKNMACAANSATLLGVPAIAAPVDHTAVATKQMADYFERTNAVVVSSTGVDCEQLMTRFFKLEPPFSTRKKHEFPDAIAGLALSGWAESQGVSLTVVADDTDWDEMVKHLPNLESLRLSNLLERLAKTEGSLEEVRDLIQQSLTRFRTGLQSVVEDRWFIVADRDEGDVEDVVLEEMSDVQIDIIDFSTLENGDFNAVVVLSGQLQFSANVSYADPDTGYYDSEDKTHYCREHASQKIVENETFLATVQVRGNLQAGSLDFEEMETNLGDRFDVYLDEDLEY